MGEDNRKVDVLVQAINAHIDALNKFFETLSPLVVDTTDTAPDDEEKDARSSEVASRIIHMTRTIKKATVRVADIGEAIDY